MQVLTVNIRAKAAALKFLRVGFCPIPSPAAGELLRSAQPFKCWCLKVGSKICVEQPFSEAQCIWMNNIRCPHSYFKMHSSHLTLVFGAKFEVRRMEKFGFTC